MDVHATSPLQRTITIRTPENLELHYRLAGAGSRIVAYLIDFLFLWLLLNLFQNLILAVVVPLFEFSPLSENWIFAILSIVSFVLLNAYFIVFEWLMSGQTPGKRVVGIRVLKDGGYALRFTDTLVRNLMRAIDFLPLFYGIGLASMLLTRRSQRVGDLLAGTVLVHQSHAAASQATPPLPERDPDAPRLAADRLLRIPKEVIHVLFQFFEILHELAPRYRQEIAVELVELIRTTSGLAPDRKQSAESFLAEVIRQTEQTALAYPPDHS